MVAFMINQQLVIGIDLGGTKISAALVDAEGHIVLMQEIPTQAEDGFHTTLQRMCALVLSLCEGRKKEQQPIAIGVAVAAQVDPSSGTVIFAPNLAWHHVPLQEELAKKLHLPVIVTGDVRAATFAEWQFGAGRGCDNFVCLFIGTGVGGGVVLGGHLQKGASNTLGELGHMIIDMNGPPCSCGNWGCLEAYAGGWAIAAHAKKLVNNLAKKASTTDYKPSCLLEKCNGNASTISAKMVIEAYQEGDVLSEQVVAKAVEAIVSGCISIVNVLNPERFVLGGSIAENIPNLLNTIEQGIHKRALPAAWMPLKIVKADLGHTAGVIGAAKIAFEACGR